MTLYDFHFLRPWWFIAGIPLLLLWLHARRNKARSNWSAVCDAHLLPHILRGQARGNDRRLSTALLCASLLSLLALAGPTWQKLPQPVFQSQSALMILLDLSRSMDCSDLSPNRLTRARYKLADILQQRQEGQTGLIVFAGDAFTVTPLTTDIKTISSLLDSLTTNIMPNQGSRVDLAITKAVELLRQAGRVSGDILLIGDGFRDGRSLAAAEQAHNEGFSLSVLAVGTAEGAPIPTGSGFLQDRDGSIIIPKLNQQQLRELAKRGGGRYRLIQVDDRDIKTLLADAGNRLRAGDRLPTQRKADRWLDQGPWLLLPLLPLAALAFRRGVLFCLLLVLPLAAPAEAIEISDLWRNQNQQAAASLAEGEAAQAAEQFTDPGWKAVAQYRAGKFRDAVETLTGLSDNAALYNRGNALAQLGEYQQAIDAYQKVPKDAPGYNDARHNIDLLKSLLEQQARQSPEPNPSAESQQRSQPERQAQNDSLSQQDEQESQQQTEQQKTGSAAKQKNNPQQDAKPQNAQQETSGNADKTQQQVAVSEQQDRTEQEHSEQWLKQIPDDPGSLLKRKFLYQYRQRQSVAEDKPW